MKHPAPVLAAAALLILSVAGAHAENRPKAQLKKAEGTSVQAAGQALDPSKKTATQAFEGGPGAAEGGDAALKGYKGPQSRFGRRGTADSGGRISSEGKPASEVKESLPGKDVTPWKPLTDWATILMGIAALLLIAAKLVSKNPAWKGFAWLLAKAASALAMMVVVLGIMLMAQHGQYLQGIGLIVAATILAYTAWKEAESYSAESPTDNALKGASPYFKEAEKRAEEDREDIPGPDGEQPMGGDPGNIGVTPGTEMPASETPDTSWADGLNEDWRDGNTLYPDGPPARLNTDLPVEPPPPRIGSEGGSAPFGDDLTTYSLRDDAAEPPVSPDGAPMRGLSSAPAPPSGEQSILHPDQLHGLSQPEPSVKRDTWWLEMGSGAKKALAGAAVGAVVATPTPLPLEYPDPGTVPVIAAAPSHALAPQPTLAGMPMSAQTPPASPFGGVISDEGRGGPRPSVSAPEGRLRDLAEADGGLETSVPAARSPSVGDIKRHDGNVSWGGRAPEPSRSAAPGLPLEYDAYIERRGGELGLDDRQVRVVKAMVQTESSGNPRAVSPKGAMGLMQLMPDKAKELGVSDPLDPYQNLDGGMREYARLLKQNRYDETHALEHYHAGAAATTFGPETRVYVEKVQATMAAPPSAAVAVHPRPAPSSAGSEHGPRPEMSQFVREREPLIRAGERVIESNGVKYAVPEFLVNPERTGGRIISYEPVAVRQVEETVNTPGEPGGGFTQKAARPVYVVKEYASSPSEHGNRAGVIRGVCGADGNCSSVGPNWKPGPDWAAPKRGEPGWMPAQSPAALSTQAPKPDACAQGMRACMLDGLKNDMQYRQQEMAKLQEGMNATIDQKSQGPSRWSGTIPDTLKKAGHLFRYGADSVGYSIVENPARLVPGYAAGEHIGQMTINYKDNGVLPTAGDAAQLYAETLFPVKGPRPAVGVGGLPATRASPVILFAEERALPPAAAPGAGKVLDMAKSGDTWVLAEEAAAARTPLQAALPPARAAAALPETGGGVRLALPPAPRVAAELPAAPVGEAAVSVTEVGGFHIKDGKVFRVPLNDPAAPGTPPVARPPESPAAPLPAAEAADVTRTDAVQRLSHTPGGGLQNAPPAEAYYRGMSRAEYDEWMKHDGMPPGQSRKWVTTDPGEAAQYAGKDGVVVRVEGTAVPYTEGQAHIKAGEHIIARDQVTGFSKVDRPAQAASPAHSLDGISDRDLAELDRFRSPAPQGRSGGAGPQASSVGTAEDLAKLSVDELQGRGYTPEQIVRIKRLEISGGSDAPLAPAGGSVEPPGALRNTMARGWSYVRHGDGAVPEAMRPARLVPVGAEPSVPSGYAVLDHGTNASMPQWHKPYFDQHPEFGLGKDYAPHNPFDADAAVLRVENVGAPPGGLSASDGTHQHFSPTRYMLKDGGYGEELSMRLRVIVPQELADRWRIGLGHHRIPPGTELERIGRTVETVTENGQTYRVNNFWYRLKPKP